MPLYPAPEKFDFRATEAFLKWKESFMMFRFLKHLEKESQEYQVTSLLYTIGLPDSSEILDSLMMMIGVLGCTDLLVISRPYLKDGTYVRGRTVKGSSDCGTQCQRLLTMWSGE